MHLTGPGIEFHGCGRVTIAHETIRRAQLLSATALRPAIMLNTTLRVCPVQDG
jgi:hypothetical protein